SLSQITTATMRTDLANFVLTVSKQYFSTVRAIIDRLDGKHLYLGCRFNRTTPEAVRAATEQCGVVSFNLHDYAITPDRYPIFDQFDSPFIVSEFSFSAVDRGQVGWGRVPVRTQGKRKDRFKEYMRALLAHPNFVGAQYFRYSDQPGTGSEQGENY